MFLSVLTRPYFDLPLSSCIRVLTWEGYCLTSSNGRKNRLNVRHLYKYGHSTNQQRELLLKPTKRIKCQNLWYARDGASRKICNKGEGYGSKSHDTQSWYYFNNSRLGLCSSAIIIEKKSTDQSRKNQGKGKISCQWHVSVKWTESAARPPPLEYCGGEVTRYCQLRYEILWQHCHGPSLLRYCLPPRWTSMVYIHSWQEFQDAAEALYSKSPNNVCFITFEKKNLISHLFYRHGIV